MDATGTNRVPRRTAPMGDPGRRALLWAWVCVALVPPAFLLAFAVGEGLSSLLGYPVGGATPPVWVMWVASVPAILVFLVPCVGAVAYGQMARQAGARAGLWPLVIGAVIGISWLVTNLAAALFQ